MLLCQRYSHEVVALANLLPIQSEVDELDSYMYQTVGHQIVAAYASCMGLPLYRRKILGASKDQRLVYEDTTGDEVEDLAALLSYIKTVIPDIGAVSSGAIASDYQRTRVERVCSRLGLVSLAYLWHQPQDPLLQRMIDAEIKAILVKVAAAGLNPRAHLGASLAQVQPHLQRLRETYGCNVCGEGGEYETMTLDCPLFTHGRIILDAWDTVHVSEDSMAPVALLHPTEFHVEAKGEILVSGEIITGDRALVIQVPDEYMAPPSPSLSASKSTDDTTTNINLICRASASQCSSITAEVTESPSSSTPITTTLHNALQDISNALFSHKLTWHDALFIHLYVPDMSQFGAANAVYSTFLPAINPPARACVQLAKRLESSSEEGLPSLVVEVLLRSNNNEKSQSQRGGSGGGMHHDDDDDNKTREKKVLHVQSISEWAPSCIGPYSQAVAHQGLVYFAGQIPLDPPTMEVATDDPGAATERSLLSCQAVAVAMKTDLRQGSLWWTVYTSSKAGNAGREAVESRLISFLTGEEFLGQSHGRKNSDDDEESASDCDTFVDEYLLAPAMPLRSWNPLVTFIEMPELPRSVVVEVQPVAWSNYGNPVEDSSSSSSDDDDSEKCTRKEKVKRVKTFFDGPHWVSQLASTQKKVNGPAGHTELHILRSTGSFFKGSAFILDVAAGKSLEDAAGQAAAELIKAMTSGGGGDDEAGGLSREDIIAAKMYLTVSDACASVDAIRKAVNAELAAENDGSSSGGDQATTTLVPVLRVGPTAAAEGGALLGIEIFARK
jgi:uncharacterized protein (TIGR00290 family)